MVSYELRKFFHISLGMIIFLLYNYLNQPLFQFFSLLSIFVVFLLYCLNIFKMQWFSKIFYLLRKREEYIGEGLIFLISSMLIGSILLEREWFFAMSTMVIFGDGFATIIGKSFGKTKLFYSSKTLEGTIAYFIFSLPAMFFVPNAWFLLVIIFSTILESFDFLEDNTSLAVFLVIARRFFA